MDDVPGAEGHLDETRKIFSFDVVVRLQVNLPQLTGSHWVVFGVELVKAMKCLSSLGEETILCNDEHMEFQQCD